MLSDHVSQNNNLITALTITSQSMLSALAHITTLTTSSMLTNLAGADTLTVLVSKLRVSSVVTCSAEALEVKS